MKKILLTGSTDGIGLELAKKLDKEGHTLLLHGRSDAKLSALRAELKGDHQYYRADLSSEFEGKNGSFYDNDNECFASPHPWALDETNALQVMQKLNAIIKENL